MKKLALISSQASALALFLGTAVQVYATGAPAEETTDIDLGGAAAGRFVVGIDPNAIVRWVIIALFSVAVLAAVIFLIWGGIKWITSGGDKGKVDGARGTIVAAIIGLIAVLLTFVILNFVTTILGLGPITQLKIPTLTGR